MILTLDLGNTNLFIGVFDNDKLVATYRTHSDITKSSDNYRDIISMFLFQKGFKITDFEGAILSSVIPSLNKSLVKAVEELLNVKCLLVGQKIKTGLQIKIDNPSELGADLVCDSIGAKNLYGYPCTIIDLGTATKYLAIDEKGDFVGCVITSGIKLSFDALARNAALLMQIDYEAPKNVLGRNSRDSLNSGAIYGTIAQIKEMSKMIDKELGYNTKKIITGGNSVLIKDYVGDDFIFDDTLILKGLLGIYRHHTKSMKK